MVNSQQLAVACSEKLFVLDEASRTNGIELLEIKPGYAKMKMLVKPEMSNALGICHGGLIFLLADAAFSYACNSDDKLAIASGCKIDYVQPAKIKDELTAICTTLVQRATLGVYDVKITNQNNETVAFFRGNAYKFRNKAILETEHN